MLLRPAVDLRRFGASVGKCFDSFSAVLRQFEQNPTKFTSQSLNYHVRLSFIFYRLLELTIVLQQAAEILALLHPAQYAAFSVLLVEALCGAVCRRDSAKRLSRVTRLDQRLSEADSSPVRDERSAQVRFSSLRPYRSSAP